MENPEEVLQLLERFTKLKQKEIPRELDDYLGFVARTGDTVYRWAVVKHLFREKLLHVITDFHDNTPSIADLPQCPNVDPFNYERMKRTLLERLDAFNSAPFTVQRICELLTEPRKQYTRIDKFMRAVEKNILVVSTQEPGRRRYDSENGDSLDSTVNGDDVCVDIEMDNEAFGIDSNEIVANSTSSSASSSTSQASSSSSSSSSSPSPSTVTTSTTTTTMTTAAAAAAAVAIEKDTEPAADEEGASVSPVKPLENQQTNKISEEHASDAKATNANNDDALSDEPANGAPADEETNGDKSTLTAETPAVAVTVQNDTEKEKSEIIAESKKDKSDIEPNSAPETDAVDAAAPRSQELADTTETVLKEATDELPTTVESPSSNEQSTTDSSTAAGDSVDDGQPQAKLAKLSEETPRTMDTLQETPETTAEAKKDDLNADATTESSDSDLSPETSEHNLTTTLTQGFETVVHLAETVPTEEPQEAVVEVIRSDPEPVTTENGCEKEVPPIAELAGENPTQAVELPTEASVSSTVETAAAPKPADVEQEPTVVVPAPSDEMEMAISAPLLASENVMATDEEETSNPNTTAVDAVVPMAADVVSDTLTKSDDNAMDVDESSVEPMDQ